MIRIREVSILLFLFNDTPTTEIYTLSLHDALPICLREAFRLVRPRLRTGLDLACSPNVGAAIEVAARSEEHTSELQSRFDLVCRLLLEKKKNVDSQTPMHRCSSIWMPVYRSNLNYF